MRTLIGDTFRSYQSREVICDYAREYRLCIGRWDGCVLAFVGWVKRSTWNAGNMSNACWDMKLFGLIGFSELNAFWIFRMCFGSRWRASNLKSVGLRYIYFPSGVVRIFRPWFCHCYGFGFFRLTQPTGTGTVLMKLSILFNTVTLTHSGNYARCAVFNGPLQWFITSFQFH